MTRVHIAQGRLEGVVENGIHCFLSVPYAASVTLRNRFLAPQPVAPRTGTRLATGLGHVCPQLPTYGPVGTTAASALTQGSDFLTLNIRTRSLQGRAPVLVWIHGGGYAVGSANERVLQTGAFAHSGIVEVTVNYRLGALGFLHVQGKPDNRGLLDQIAALEWVRDNIAAFGGDPELVTLAGRSAGGFSVAAIMAMPGARGLFAKAMPQSGSSTAVATREDADRLTWRVSRRLDVTADALEDVALDALLVAQRDLCNQSYDHHDFERDGSAAMLGVPFVPVIDHVSLPEHPEDAALSGRTAPVPMMTGCTTSECLTHSSVLPEALDDQGVADLVHQRVRALGWTGAAIVARYRRALPDHCAHGLWRAIGGDLVFQNPCTRFARLHAARHPVHKYLYGRVEQDEKGAPHGGEVGQVWYRDGGDMERLPARHRVDNPDFARAVHDVWVSFIRDDAPRTPAGVWPTYTASNATVLRIEPEVVGFAVDPFDIRPALWHHSADGIPGGHTQDGQGS